MCSLPYNKRETSATTNRRTNVQIIWCLAAKYEVIYLVEGQKFEYDDNGVYDEREPRVAAPMVSITLGCVNTN